MPDAPPEEGVIVTPVLGRLRDAEKALQRIDTISRELGDPYFINRILPRREAVDSSAIEGTNSTLDDLLSIEETGYDEKGSAAQVRDYALALERLLPQAELSIFTLDLVQNLHRAIMANDAAYKDRPGDLRTGVVWIGGGRDIAYSTYNPPPPDHVHNALEGTLAFMRAPTIYQLFVTRMAVAHAHFEAVHPFRDGNGRVGRLLLPLMMAADGHTPLYLSPYIETHRSEYYGALKAAQQRLEWYALTGFFSDAIVATVEESLKTRDALSTLQSMWRGRRRFRKGSGSYRALDLLQHYPVITAARLSRLLEIPSKTAFLAIDQLVDAGILVEKTGYVRNRIFVASEVMRVMNRPFGEDPVL